MSTLRTINESLPIKLSEEDVESMPELANLLLALSKKITPNGNSIKLQESIEEAEDILTKEKNEWLQHKILLAAAKQVLVEYEMKAIDEELSEPDKEFCQALNECLAFAEMIPHLHPSGDSDVSVLGLTAEHLKKQRKRHEPILNRIRSEVQELMKQKCINIAQFYLPGGKTNNADLNLAKACQLPALVEAQVSELEAEQQQLETLKNEKMLLQEERYKIFKDSLLELQNICNKKLQLQKDLKSTTSKYLLSYSKTLHSKLVLCNTEIIYETYKEDTVLALKKIKEHIDKELKKAKEQNRQANEAVSEYEKLGPEYTTKVEQYRKLEQEIESIKWSLDRLKNSS
ncbi:HAUS augmin-like complex subunit 4 isoform X1 [Octopus vulgaris]|uniref:HAUS augmin-like complex subunit 4 isoform X1 n=1 Tax=Octopus vulgaris TaxID=6645 RepID=A0AA36EXY6_OCTVU|nr:HAUS augmin-like complex subunit 4 isoform X1 [Octopus vulgaris]